VRFSLFKNEIKFWAKINTITRNKNSETHPPKAVL
jgi:hypothetical protein